MAENEIGSITWADLTVIEADQICDFYKEVVGRNDMAVDMGGYNARSRPLLSDSRSRWCVRRFVSETR